jgi:hypothetical protein
VTLGEGKRKVYKLLDEYSSGGTVTADADIEARMADFFDTAQKQAAAVRRIVNLEEIVRVEGVTDYALPDNFGSLYRIWRDGEVSKGRYRFKGNTIVIPETDDAETIELEYFAVPATIGADTDDDYEFEVSEDAAQCMPFFVAAQQLVSDLIVDSGSLMNLYDRALALLDRTLPGQGSLGVRNSLYR